jgi:hypothetical protein
MTRALVCCVLLVGLTGCASPAPAGAPASAGQPAGAAPAAPAGADPSEHVVVAIQGQLAIKRPSWSQFVPAIFGTLVRVGDELKLEGSSVAKIACSDLSLVTVKAGAVGVPCQVVKPVMLFQGSSIRATRADTGSGFPTVLAPRKTSLLAERPLIRWAAVTGATVYKVSLRGPNVGDWSAEVVGKTELQYPDSAPALTPGEAYKVTVVATTPTGSRSSDEEAAADLGFVVLKPEERQAVRDAQARIDKLELEEAQKRFLVAKLYTAKDYRLYAEAIDQLEALDKSLAEPAVGRTLAESYRAVSLNRAAEEHYRAALDRSQMAGDVEGQALAQEALGQLESALGNSAEAVQRTQNALELYQSLGDVGKVKELQDRLASLPKA